MIKAKYHRQSSGKVPGYGSLRAVENLNKAEIRRASRLLKAKGLKLPKSGMCEDLIGKRQPINAWKTHAPSPTKICRDGTGYYLIGQYNTPQRRAALRDRLEALRGCKALRGCRKGR